MACTPNTSCFKSLGVTKPLNPVRYRRATNTLWQSGHGQLDRNLGIPTYHQGSSKMTVEAAVRLRPTPPALSDTSMTVMLSSVAKLWLGQGGHNNNKCCEPATRVVGCKEGERGSKRQARFSLYPSKTRYELHQPGRSWGFRAKAAAPRPSKSVPGSLTLQSKSYT